VTDAAATREAVLAFVDALNGGDPDRIAGSVTDDFHNEHTSALGNSLRGRAAYRERLPHFLGQFQDLHYAVEDTVVEDERAAVPYRMTFRYDGHPVTIRGVFRFRVARGLISHRVDYWDSAEFTRQITPEGSP
jgi:ketosteroid isomerase-like protein